MNPELTVRIGARRRLVCRRPKRGGKPSRAFATVCRAAARQLAARPDAQRLLDDREPLPPDSERIFDRLWNEHTPGGSVSR